MKQTPEIFFLASARHWNSHKAFLNSYKALKSVSKRHQVSKWLRKAIQSLLKYFKSRSKSYETFQRFSKGFLMLFEAFVRLLEDFKRLPKVFQKPYKALKSIWKTFQSNPKPSNASRIQKINKHIHQTQNCSQTSHKSASIPPKKSFSSFPLAFSALKWSWKLENLPKDPWNAKKQISAFCQTKKLQHSLKFQQKGSCSCFCVFSLHCRTNKIPVLDWLNWFRWLTSCWKAYKPS